MEMIELTEEELNILYALPFFVAALVASADGNIDNAEVRRAVTAIKAQNCYGKNPYLTDIYRNASEDTEDKLKIVISNSPYKAHDRVIFFSKKIADTNIVLNKLNPDFVISIHNCLQHLARHIAKASGGILGYGSVGAEESQLLALNFIHIPKLKD